MIDIVNQLSAIHRQVTREPSESGETVTVLLRRDYDAPIDDVWHAVTDPERLRRWFLPVSGDLRVGGKFQLEGNAGGEILTCEPPRLLRVTFGAPTSLVELRLSATDEDATALELVHTAPVDLAGSGAGALYVGPGWDGALLSLALFVPGEVSDDPVAAANSPEGQEFSRGSVHAWVDVVTASGTASPEEITAATAVSLAQFAPDVATAERQD
ncbi:SRPBCC family protein [Micromonospora inyonensis]|uniref:Uncharacterized conserved protein YndB, AHSA1/START domain n=1 Tax=Micromonospora inyonensis TaxID=47866 RepID=A0A1C6SFM5_9ACTN|nr:SRPBCC family protein [Micromonospora inyonensis]SCL28276.1 Uncharacterized conserved protein YndB, AHSA1/START domain [Micromonospora inyonensis]